MGELLCDRGNQKHGTLAMMLRMTVCYRMLRGVSECLSDQVVHGGTTLTTTVGVGGGDWDRVLRSEFTKSVMHIRKVCVYNP